MEKSSMYDTKSLTERIDSALISQNDEQVESLFWEDLDKELQIHEAGLALEDLKLRTWEPKMVTRHVTKNEIIEMLIELDLEDLEEIRDEIEMML